MAYIYTLSRPDTDEIVYVGRTCKNLDTRLNEHIYDCKRKSTKVYNWIKSLLKKGLKPKIECIEECTCIESLENEKFWILYLKFLGFNLKNLTMGGDGSYFISEEQRKEFSKKVSGKNNPFYGKKHTEETKKLISERGKGRKMPESHKKSCRERMKNYKPTQETIDKISEKHKIKINQLTLEGEYVASFDSLKEAMLFTKIDSSKISMCINNKRRQTGGYKWEKQ